MNWPVAIANLFYSIRRVQPLSAGISVETPTSPERARKPMNNSVPWAVRRDGVKDGRSMVPVWIQETTSERQQDVKRKVEDLLGYTVYPTDFKEAAMLHGLENPLEIASQLDEWGCGYA